MSKVTCLQWHAAFRKGRDSCELQGGPDAPVTVLSDVTINTAGCLIATDPHLTTRELAGILDISLGTVHTLLHDHLNVSRIHARWILCLLTPKQKKQRITLCEYWSECVHKEEASSLPTRVGFMPIILPQNSRVQNGSRKVKGFPKTDTRHVCPEGDGHNLF